MAALLLAVGLVCFLIVSGWLVRLALGRQWDEDFVSNFVFKGITIALRGVILLFAIAFVVFSAWVIEGLIKGNI